MEWMAKWCGPGVALALAAAGCSESRTSGVNAKLSLGASALDFGKSRPASTQGRTLEVSNASTVPLDFQAATIDGPGRGAFAVSGVPSKLEPGEKAAVQLSFNPPAEGSFKATLSLPTNAPDCRRRSRSRAAARTPSCAWSPSAARRATPSPPPRPARPRLRRAPAPAARQRRQGRRRARLAYRHAVNEGELPVTIQSVSLEGSPDFSTAEPIGAQGFPIGAGAGQALHVLFDPTSGAASSAGALVVRSDDPASPELRVALSGTLAPAPDLQVCAAIVESQGPDGSISTPRNAQGEDDFAGAQPPVQPGKNALVTFSAFSDHFLAAGDPTRCTWSPETGRDGLKLSWTLEEKPAESSAALEATPPPSPRSPRTPSAAIRSA
jgi:hypothetical protein